jgi:hypothetical protein
MIEGELNVVRQLCDEYGFPEMLGFRGHLDGWIYFLQGEREVGTVKLRARSIRSVPSESNPQRLILPAVGVASLDNTGPSNRLARNPRYSRTCLSAAA